MRIIAFEPLKGCDEEELEETFETTLRELGKTIAKSVVVGECPKLFTGIEEHCLGGSLRGQEQTMKK